MKTFEDYNNEMFNKMLATDFELNGEKQAMINMLNDLSKKQEELEEKIDFIQKAYSKEPQCWYAIGGHTKYLISNHGKVWSCLKKKELKQYNNGLGYLKVNLDGKQYFVHRLVGQEFVENPNDKPDINHIDGIKSNNHWKNLEWVTKSENTKHAYSIGSMKPMKGDDHPMRKKGHTQEAKEKIRKARLGVSRSEETKKRISKSMIGKNGNT